MFEKKSTNDESYITDDSLNVFKPSKRSATVIISNGVKIIANNLYPYIKKGVEALNNN